MRKIFINILFKFHKKEGYNPVVWNIEKFTKIFTDSIINRTELSVNAEQEITIGYC